MAVNTPTTADPRAFVEAVENKTRRQDALFLLDLMQEFTGEAPVMWGSSMVGYGAYHYQYESGRKGDWFRTGFSPRKANLAIYILPGLDFHTSILERLGKHKRSVSCLYVNKLADIDLEVLKELIISGWRDMERRYPK